MITNLLGQLFKSTPGIPQSQNAQQPKSVFPRIGDQPKAETPARGFFAVLKDVATQLFSKQKTPNVSAKLPKPVVVPQQYLPETTPAIVTKAKAPAESNTGPNKPTPQKQKQTEKVTETLIPLQMVLQQAVPLQPKVFAPADTPKQAASKTEAAVVRGERPVLQVPIAGRPLPQTPTVDRPSSQITVAQMTLSQTPAAARPSPQMPVADKPTARTPVLENSGVRAPQNSISAPAKTKQPKLPAGMQAVKEERVQVEVKGTQPNSRNVDAVKSSVAAAPQAVIKDTGVVAPKQEIRDVRGTAHTQETKQVRQNPTINVMREIQGFWQKHLKVEKPVQPLSPTLAVPREERGKEEVASVKVSESVKPTQSAIQTVQAERLGGTEQNTKAPKESRVNREKDVPVSTPKSFWGVKVVNEPQPRQIEELPKVAIQTDKPASKAEQPVTKKAPVAAMPAAELVRKKEEPLPTVETRPAAHVEPKTVTPQAVKPVEEQAQKFDTATEKERLPLPKMAVAEPAALSNEKIAEAPRSNVAETPVAPQMVTTASEPQVVTVQTPLAPRAMFTLEQIKELQAIVAKGLQGAKVTVDGAREAVFNWNHDVLGPLAFRISARKDDVEIQIQSNRRDVAEALEEGRGTVERMIADIGLKVERFEVKLRSEAWNQDLANQTHERDQSRHGRKAEGEAGTGASGNLDLDADEEGPAATASTPARGWVA